MATRASSSEEEEEECPLCMEPLELDDQNFYPCSCGYQICRFCWHRLRTEENGLCPACRAPYSDTPAEYTPVTSEERDRIKAEKRAKRLARKQSVIKARSNLATVRVVQKCLVYVIGLPPRISDETTLRRNEYFGQYGKILKVVVNRAPYGNPQNPSYSAYVTFSKPEAATRCVRGVHHLRMDGRVLRASLGTTKYCSNFLRNLPCDNHDCMYLHELGDDAVSYSKDEMLAGRHVQDVNVTFEQQHQAQAQVAAQQAAAKAGGPVPKSGSAAKPSGGGTSAPAWGRGPTPGEAVGEAPAEQGRKKSQAADKAATKAGDAPLTRSQKKALQRRQQQEQQQQRLLAQQQRAEQLDVAEAEAAAAAAAGTPAADPVAPPSQAPAPVVEDWPTLGGSAPSTSAPQPATVQTAVSGWGPTSSASSAQDNAGASSPKDGNSPPSGLVSLGTLPSKASSGPLATPPAGSLSTPLGLRQQPTSSLESSADSGLASLQTLRLGSSSLDPAPYDPWARTSTLQPPPLDEPFQGGFLPPLGNGPNLGLGSLSMADTTAPLGLDVGRAAPGAPIPGRAASGWSMPAPQKSRFDFAQPQPQPPTSGPSGPHEAPASSAADSQAWQAQIRALFPNVNISFGGSDGQGLGQAPPPSLGPPPGISGFETDGNGAGGTGSGPVGRSPWPESQHVNGATSDFASLSLSGGPTGPAGQSSQPGSGSAPPFMGETGSSSFISGLPGIPSLQDIARGGGPPGIPAPPGLTTLGLPPSGRTMPPLGGDQRPGTGGDLWASSSRAGVAPGSSSRWIPAPGGSTKPPPGLSGQPFAQPPGLGLPPNY